jgi:hypothetical protein
MLTRPSRRIRREQRTIEAMVHIYCRAHHDAGGDLCPDCGVLLDYAKRRLVNCPFQESKTACNRCQVHCYSSSRRAQVKAVMRYAGPRMLLRHPVLAFFHLLGERREPAALAVSAARESPAGGAQAEVGGDTVRGSTGADQSNVCSSCSPSRWESSTRLSADVRLSGPSS